MEGKAFKKEKEKENFKLIDVCWNLGKHMLEMLRNVSYGCFFPGFPGLCEGLTNKTKLISSCNTQLKPYSARKFDFARLLQQQVFFFGSCVAKRWVWHDD